VTRIRSTYSLIRDHKCRSLAASNRFGGFSYDDADAIECNRIRKVLQLVTDAVIRVYDAIGNAIETHEHAGDFKES
jgi:hypothetical protein